MGRLSLSSLLSQRIFPVFYCQVSCGCQGSVGECPGIAVLGKACLVPGRRWGSHCGHLHRASLCPSLALGGGRGMGTGLGKQWDWSWETVPLLEQGSP